MNKLKFYVCREMYDFFYQNPPVGVVRAIGEDTVDYLQSQWSVDLQKLKIGCSRFGLRLNTRGKILAGAYLLKLDEEEVLLVSRGHNGNDLVSILEENVVADEVEFHDESEVWKSGTLCIADIDTIKKITGSIDSSSGEFIKIEDGIVFSDQHFSEQALFLLMKKNSSFPNPDPIKIKEISDEEYNCLRIRAKCYEIPLELGLEELPQEANMENRSVDFDKGCYLGQEVMARLHAMGQVQRKMVSVQWGQDHTFAPNLPMPILMESKKVGLLKSLYKDRDKWVGSAIIHQKAMNQLKENGLALEDNGFGKVHWL
jgi:folate-binding protein YgfZ